MAGAKGWSLEQLKWVLLKAFVFLGPLGNLLTPQFLTNSFRTYYLILLGFPLFWVPLQKRLAKFALFVIPIFLYCLFSSFYTLFAGHEDAPFSKLALFIAQSFFAIGAATCIREFGQVIRLIRLYLYSFFVSLLIGYVFYVGYYLSLIPLTILENFSVLTQIGYGFLRFSPGSYPNEYGIVASFVLSILTFALLEYKKLQSFNFFSKKNLVLLFGLTLAALLLTTTRSAYLSYVFTLCYLAWKKRRLFKVIGIAISGVICVIALLTYFDIHILEVVKAGFNLENFETGSLGERMVSWENSYEHFRLTPYLGTGFSSQSGLHNLYLQILFELGILGVILSVGMLTCFFLEKRYIHFSRRVEASFEHQFVRTIVIVGFVHVFWFAASNHNLNHHLTWFVVFLGLSLVYLRKNELQQCQAA